MKISRRAQFITGEFPEEVVSKLRQQKPFMPISVGLIIVDRQFKNLVVGTPKAEHNPQDTCAPVPIQERLIADGPPRRLATALTYALLGGRINQDDLTYLGYGHGQHRRGTSCQQYGKCVLWFGYRASSNIRRRGSAKLHNVANFSSPSWMEIKRWQALHAGEAVSDVKFRMVMQALLVFGQKNDISNANIATAHRVLSEQQLIPAL